MIFAQHIPAALADSVIFPADVCSAPGIPCLLADAAGCAESCPGGCRVQGASCFWVLELMLNASVSVAVANQSPNPPPSFSSFLSSSGCFTGTGNSGSRLPGEKSRQAYPGKSEAHFGEDSHMAYNRQAFFAGRNFFLTVNFRDRRKTLVVEHVVTLR